MYIYIYIHIITHIHIDRYTQVYAFIHVLTNTNMFVDISQSSSLLTTFISKVNSQLLITCIQTANSHQLGSVAVRPCKEQAVAAQPRRCRGTTIDPDPDFTGARQHIPNTPQPKSGNIPTLPRTSSSWPAMAVQSYINPPTHSPCINPTMPRGQGCWRPLPGSAMVPAARKTTASSSLSGSLVGLNVPGRDWVLASLSLGRSSAIIYLSSCP